MQTLQNIFPTKMSVVFLFRFFLPFFLFWLISTFIVQCKIFKSRERWSFFRSLSLHLPRNTFQCRWIWIVSAIQVDIMIFRYYKTGRRYVHLRWIYRWIEIIIKFNTEQKEKKSGQIVECYLNCSISKCAAVQMLWHKSKGEKNIGYSKSYNQLTHNN